MKCLVIVLALAAPCYAQHITVSDQVPPPVKYPAEVYKMSDAQFFEWASNFNKKQVADVEVRRAKITEDKWITGERTTSSESHVEYNRFGSYNGYGCNGYSNRFAACNSYNYGCDSYGSGDTGQYGSSSQETTTYPVRWPNPAYHGPGPLTIVNPYCRPTK
jgi:hypothetical protein